MYFIVYYKELISQEKNTRVWKDKRKLGYNGAMIKN